MKIILFLLFNTYVYTLLKQVSTEITSHIINVETNYELKTFNLLITFTTYVEDHEFMCKYNQMGSQFEKPGSLEDKFIFSNRTHYFFKFENLNQHVLYNYYCFDPSSESVIINKSIKFPKNKVETNLLAFGDWGISKEGNMSTPVIESMLDNNDAVLFLGDISYDLDSLGGENGNIFLQYAKKVTSGIPFQVKIHNISSVLVIMRSIIVTSIIIKDFTYRIDQLIELFTIPMILIMFI